MKKFVILIATALFLLADANAFDINLLSNDKETFSRELTKEDQAAAIDWATHHHLGEDFSKQVMKALQNTFNEMERINTGCELGLISTLTHHATKLNLIMSEQELPKLMNYLRGSQLTDDILYRIMKDSYKISNDFTSKAERATPLRPFNLYTSLNAGIDLKKLYSKINKKPDDIKVCLFDAYYDLTSTLKFKSTKDRDLQIQKINYIAFKQNVIDLETLLRLETLRKRKVLERPVSLRRYMDIINNAKNKLTKDPEKKPENEFPVEYVSKRSGLTQRGNLFNKYNSTQIMILAQIIEKTAKRMDSKQSTLNWQYTDDPNGEGEIYVLSPMEQYRAAIKMLRKDMGEIMRSEAFKNVEIDYDHFISAAYEAGFIKSEELDYVLRFEEFWNPSTPKWQAYSKFAFTLARSASFYFPPPWNIIGAVALVLTQTKLLNGNKKPDSDDNWNVII